MEVRKGGCCYNWSKAMATHLKQTRSLGFSPVFCSFSTPIPIDTYSKSVTWAPCHEKKPDVTSQFNTIFLHYCYLSVLSMDPRLAYCGLTCQGEVRALIKKACLARKCRGVYPQGYLWNKCPELHKT